MAVGRSQLSQSFLVKMLHQILPVSTLIHKYDPVIHTMNNLNLILLYTFPPSAMIEETMIEKTFKLNPAQAP
jgi:hypothetical protein